MALVNLQDIYKSFGENIILEGVSLQLHKGERMGLVGANGSGKTTLLKIIVGEEERDGGKIFFSRGLTWGYLSQKPALLPETTLRDYLTRAVGDILAMKEKMIFLEKQLSLPHVKENRSLTAELMDKYGELSHIFEEKGGYSLEARLHEVARGLGFKKEDFARQMTSFSGGEKTRAQLASLLLGAPEVLFLDEPTNSLDADAVEWLEGYLQSWQGALLVVSHDRYFLDCVVQGIAALEGRKVRYFRGNYSSFVSQREHAKKFQEKALKKQSSVWKKDMDFIRNATADERTKKQARSREKRLEKMKPLQEIKKARAMNLDFKFAGRSGRVVTRLNGVAVCLGEDKILHDVNLEINWGDRLAVLGPNGSGKSTLLKVVTGEISPSAGRVYFGPSVKAAYFDQEQKELCSTADPLEVIMTSSRLTETEARKHLGRFLFQGDEVFKKVGELSGGEKSRLAIARMALNQCNFLIMDEPTNHLDIEGMEELEAALDSFPGTLLLVSHDRYFISRLARGIIEVKEGRVRFFKGNYEEFLRLRAQQEQEGSSSCGHSEDKRSRLEKWEKEKEEQRRLEAQEKQKHRLRESLENLEEKSWVEEEKLAKLEKRLAKPQIYQDYEQARQVMEEMNAAKERLEDLYSCWEKTARQLEDLSLFAQKK